MQPDNDSGYPSTKMKQLLLMEDSESQTVGEEGSQVRYDVAKYSCDMENPHVVDRASAYCCLKHNIEDKKL